jgi:hypothetical protein
MIQRHFTFQTINCRNVLCFFAKLMQRGQAMCRKDRHTRQIRCRRSSNTICRRLLRVSDKDGQMHWNAFDLLHLGNPMLNLSRMGHHKGQDGPFSFRLVFLTLLLDMRIKCWSVIHLPSLLGPARRGRESGNRNCDGNPGSPWLIR